MRAWEIQGAFGLENLRLTERPTPEPGRGEVRLRVLAASLNYRDLLMVQGQYNPTLRGALVPCSDMVGVVKAVGEGVSRWREGDRVCPLFVQGWTGGRAERSMMQTTLGGPVDGALREQAVFHETALVRAPAHLSDAEAACLPCAAVTAWRALVSVGQLRAGEVVLTQGTGGVSLFALQIARMHGARVAITSSSDERLERARALGATWTVNYRERPDWGRAVLELTGGADHVMELGGAGTFDQSLRAVRLGGAVHLIGNLAGAKAEVQLTRIFMNGVRVLGAFVGSGEDLQALVRGLEAHPEVRPVVDRVFGFGEVHEAFQWLAGARHMGKIVLSIGERT
jgi:NADPH:quinone reductase-like Zn-dependent oxidoreductase